MKRTALSALLAVSLASAPARALVWPDVPDRIEHELASTDPAVRAVAVEKLDTLGRSRATPLLIAALSDADPGVRLAAAGSTLRMPIDGATVIVIPWLGEHDVRLRLAACAVARAMPDPRAVAPLARALSDTDPSVRASAIEALGAQRSAEALAPLLGKLDDGVPAVRVELARALARIGDRRAVMPLIGKVEDNVPEVREAVARALGDLGDSRAAPALLLQLRDASTDVKSTALAALARVHGVEAVDAIAPLTTDRSPVVRRAALTSLGTLAAAGSVDALRLLLAQVSTDSSVGDPLASTPLREAVVVAGDAAVPLLRQVLRTGASPAAVATAAWILGALRASVAAPEIVAALRGGTLSKVAALRALSSVGSGPELPVVLEFVGDPNPAVRDEAIASARALLDPRNPDGRAVDPLLAAAESANLGVKEQLAVIDLLGRTGARRATPVLLGLLASHDHAIEVAALDALAALGPGGADEALLAKIKDPVPQVRLHAASAIAASGGPATRDTLLALLRAGGEVDRAAALTALRGVLRRAPSDAAWKVLEDELALAAGGERDAVLLVLGQSAPLDAVVERLARSDDPVDRRTLAAALAGRPSASPLLERLLSDPDVSVRADAAWSLGSGGDDHTVPTLIHFTNATGERALPVAVNATAALGRVTARTGSSEGIRALCSLERDPRPLVRSNAVAGIALAGGTCAVVTPRSAPITHEALTYVASLTRDEPQPGVSYLARWSDGLVRAGVTDRQGAFYDPVAPEGMVRLVSEGSEDGARPDRAAPGR